MSTNCLAFEISHQLLKQFTTIEFKKTLTMSVSCDRINEKNCKDTNIETPWRSHNKIENMIHNSGPGNGKNSVPNRRTCHGDSSDVAEIL